MYHPGFGFYYIQTLVRISYNNYLKSNKVGVCGASYCHPHPHSLNIKGEGSIMTLSLDIFQPKCGKIVVNLIELELSMRFRIESGMTILR